MVSKAAFSPGDPNSNPGWFAVSNSNKKFGFETANQPRFKHRSPGPKVSMLTIELHCIDLKFI